MGHPQLVSALSQHLRVHEGITGELQADVGLGLLKVGGLNKKTGLWSPIMASMSSRKDDGRRSPRPSMRRIRVARLVKADDDVIGFIDRHTPQSKLFFCCWNQI